MIKLDRSNPPGVPTVLLSQAAINERKRTADYYQGNNTGFPAYAGFSIYRNEQVREALELLAHGKCAYCESQMTNQSPRVEHYRPKGGIDLTRGGQSLIGYWWLACEWDNLLPACEDCNTERKHSVPGGEDFKTGKGNYFPLAQGQQPASCLAHLPQEVPLLLNPFIDNPRRYLRFRVRRTANERKSFVVGVWGAAALLKRRAEESISGYALNRDRLVRARSEELLRLEDALEEWKAYLKLADSVPAGIHQENAIKHSKATLEKIFKVYASPQSKYSAACFDYLMDWLKQNNLRI